jgi:uncharacterized repeat protein (TIGR01451 family)
MQLSHIKTNSSLRARTLKNFQKIAISATSFLALALIGTSLVSGEASAAGNPQNTDITRLNSIYVYAKAGETIDAQFTKATTTASATKSAAAAYKPGDGENASYNCGPILNTDPVGTNCGTSLTGMTSNQDGIWKINFAPSYENVTNSDSTIDSFTWDVTVKAGSTTKKGRTWTEKYNMHQAWPSESRYADAPYNESNVDLSFWWVSEEGYQYNAKYKDFNGIYSTFFANPYGLVHSGTCTPVYQSKDQDDVGDGLPVRGLTDSSDNCGGRYKMFFEPPATDLPENAVNWRGDSEWINKPIKTPKIDGVKFVKTTPDTGVRTGTIKFNVTGYAGTAKIEIDANGDNEFNGPTDFTESVPVTSGENIYEYAGVDKEGNPIPNNQTVNFKIKLDKLAEIHFVNGDVEHRGQGIEINRLNGPLENRDKISWDDTALKDLVPNRCSGIDQLQANKVSSSGGKHGWKGMGEDGEDNLDAACTPFAPNPYTQGVTWGDARYMDEWANIETNIVLDYSLPAELSSDLSLVKTVIDAPQVVKNGDIVNYKISVTNSGPDTVENVEVVDKPSEKLEYVSNTVSVGTFSPSDMKWKIPKIEIDETVSLDLSFRVKDATPEITNLAEIISSGNPDNDSTPNNCAGGTKLEDDCAVSTLNLGKAIGAPKTGAIVGAIIVSVATLSLAGYLMKEVYDKREMKLKSQK